MQVNPTHVATSLRRCTLNLRRACLRRELDRLAGEILRADEQDTDRTLELYQRRETLRSAWNRLEL